MLRLFCVVRNEAEDSEPCGNVSLLDYCEICCSSRSPPSAVDILMEQRIKSCRSSKIMFRERGDLLAVLLLLLLVLAGTGLAKQDEHRK